MERGTANDSIILGIDPGTVITGYGIIRYGTVGSSAIDFGCIKPPPKYPLPKRYLIIFEALCHLMDRYRPASIAVETQFVSKNPQSTIKLGMARAMALLAAAQREIPIFEYPPTIVKRAVSGFGGTGKEQVQRMMQLLLKLPSPPEPEDAADALALALCHGQSLTLKNRIERTRHD